MNSCLYFCKVNHTRLKPKKYGFDTKFFWFYLDLDEIELINKKSPLLSVDRFNIYSFLNRDFLPSSKKHLKTKVIEYLKDQGVEEEVKKVYLLSTFRLFNYVFNPVSFYFIETELNSYAIVEVCNTFWEIKPFFVSSEHFKQGVVEFETTKEFYISPFASMDNTMKFRIHKNDNKIRISIIDRDVNGDVEITTSLVGEKREFTNKNLFKTLLFYPLMTFKITYLIHYHALRLFLLKIPFYKKSDQTELQKGYVQWK